MADVNANIDINIDSSNALAQLKALQRQISQFHTSIAKSSEAAALAQKGLQKNLLNSINAIGAFTAEMRTVRTSAESFTDSLEKNKFSMREYFRYAGASTKTFGRLFKSEFDTIGKVAEERVKRLQTQYIKMGRDTNGAMRAMAIMPTQLDMSDYTTRVQIAAQKQALFNQLMKQGSTNLLNFGKNTQWAGRQLMVGFTLPLMAVGTAASKAFMDMEAQALKFRKVYGDLFTPKGETQRALEDITELAKQFTKYGVAVSTTVGLAAEAAAAGFQGLDLQRQTTEATRLSILGQVDSQKALETTISLQNAFGMSSEKLADSINFLNAVENQTVVSLDDITTAIPKVAPVIQQLGGDVKDLTFFIAAMKEGGINASEGANALKSGLAALINPTKKASDMLASFGINATAIVEKNKGDLKATVIGFANALNTLDPLSRARAIEQMFGKFQFARLSTLFANVAKDGNQAARVLDLANSSVEELSALSEQELGMSAESSMNKFKKTVEDLKIALVPVGQAFLEAATPIVEFVGNILEKFANLSSGTKRLITLLTVGIGAVGPVLLMTFGLLANGIANIIKLFLTLRGGYQRLTGQTSILGEQTQYMTMEQLDAAAAAHSLNQTHATLTQTFTAETAQIAKLISAYNSAAGAARNFAMNNPGMMMPGRGAKRLASGIVSVPGPKGAGDIVPAMLSPGESVIPADMTKKYAGLIQGMIAGNIPGYENGNISFGGRSFSVNPKGQVSIQRMINETKSLSSVIGNIDDLILNALINAENELTAKGRVRAKSLQDQLKTIAGGAIPLAKTTAAAQGGFKGNAGIVAAHGTPGRMISASQAQELGRQLGSGAVASQLINTNKNVKMLSNLTFPMPASFNKGQLTGRESAKFIGQNRSRFTSMIAKQNNLNPNDPGLLEFGKSIGQALKQVGNNVVSERDFENIIATGIENMLEGAAKTALIKSRDTFGTAQLSGVSGREGHGGIQRVTLPSSATGQTFGGLQLGGQSYRQQDISQYNAQADKFVIETIKKRTKNFGSSMVIAVEEGLRETLQAASPSRKMKKIGQDAGQGLILGAQEYVDDAKRVGQKLGAGMVQTASGLFVPGGALGQPGSVAANVPRPGVPMSVLNAAYEENAMRDLMKKQQQKIVIANQRMNSLNKAFMSGTFALSALSGVASMAGGNLGKFSQILFQITGPLFALSSIIQLLTGEKIIKLISNFKVAFGLASVALVAGIGVIKIVNDARKKELEYIYGLSNAMKTTTQQVKTLGDFFGIVPTKLPINLKNREVVRKNVRSERDRLRADEGFQKEFAPTIKTLSAATAKEASLAFTTLALNLKAQGFASEQVQTIIDALREEAGKTSIKLDVKSLDFSAESVKGLQSQIAPIILDLEKNLQTRLTGSERFLSGVQSALFGRGFRMKEITDASQKSLSDLAGSISSVSNSAAGMFKLGLISADDFEATMFAILGTTKNLSAENQKLVLMEIFKSLNIDAAPFLANLKGVVLQMQTLALISSGVLDKDSGIFKLLASKDYEDQQRGRKALIKLYDETIGAINKVVQADKKAEDAANAANSAAGKTNPLKERIKAIQNQTNAYIILRNAKVDEATATELSNDAEIASLVLANSKGQSLTNLIALINEYKAAIKGQTDAELKYMEKPNLFKKQLQQYQAQAELREKLIDVQFASKIKAENDALKIQEESLRTINDEIQKITDSQIKPIQAVIDANNFALESISLQEDAINQRYNTQIEALDKIATLNQNIANIQKQRLSIADALTRGDISAAAQLAQEARAENAASSVTGQKDALTFSRDAQIKALGRVEIEKQNKTLQLEISKIERESLLTLQQKKETIENTIGSITRNIEKLNSQVEKLKDGAYYAGQTRTEIDSLAGLIDAAEKAGIPFNTLLLSQAGSAAALAKSLSDAVTAQKSLASLPGLVSDAKVATDTKIVTDTKTVTGTGSTVTVKSGNTLSGIAKAAGVSLSDVIKANPQISNPNLIKPGQKINIPGKMYGGQVMPQSKGGMGISKSMKFGGTVVGSDSVPTMLTPGEFVMNKAASKAYGPLLERINESKYPSMLNRGQMSQVPVSNISTSMSDNSTAVYNYNLGFNINGNNSNPNDIARAVMREIKNVDSQRIRRQRV